MYKRIVVPLDGSELAEGVLPAVRSITERYPETEVVLMRVIAYPHYEALEADANATERMLQTLKEHSSAYLQRIAEGLATQGVRTRTEVRLARGPVADAIVDFVDDVEAELVAMCTHGRSGPARWLLGSVAERVVRGARCPVLLYRPIRHGRLKA